MGMMIERTVTFIRDFTPEGLQKKLFQHNVSTGKSTQIINICQHANYWYAWLYTDLKSVNKEVTKKKTRKKKVASNDS